MPRRTRPEHGSGLSDGPRHVGPVKAEGTGNTVDRGGSKVKKMVEAVVKRERDSVVGYQRPRSSEERRPEEQESELEMFERSRAGFVVGVRGRRIY